MLHLSTELFENKSSSFSIILLTNKKQTKRKQNLLDKLMMVLRPGKTYSDDVCSCLDTIPRVATFQSTSNASIKKLLTYLLTYLLMTFPDTSSYIYVAVQTARIIINTHRNTSAQLIQQCKCKHETNSSNFVLWTF